MRATASLLALSLVLLSLGACRTDTKPDSGGELLDADGDGYVADDCDDGDAAIHPEAEEICDGLDNDCDGETDEGVLETWYADADGDGWGDAQSTTEACDAPQGYVGAEQAGDCDDADAEIHPAASERCDGLDNDCDGEIDEDVLDTWFADADGDGYGDAGVSIEECDPGAGWVADDQDCADDDGEIHPAAAEICDGLDNDCDALIDEDDPDLLGAATWYQDSDGDGYGADAKSQQACEAPEGYVSQGGDCDDGDVAYHPGASEEDCADPNDYNCDGSTGYTDADGDGWAACEECDDANSAINPDALEHCDGYDNDCDGSVDEDDAVDAATWYADADGDGYGDVSQSAQACDAPTGYVADATDCDDNAVSVNPGASELCNEIDDDCDGDVDEDDAADAATWYADADGDGFGDAASAVQACEAPTDYVADGTDCDDGDDDVNPGATETCDGVDEDCDGDVDEDAVDAETWYADVDGDGYGDSSLSSDACEAPTGYVGDDSDCDDGDAAVNPGAQELCDSLDNDCDGETDEADAADASTWYGDADGDGYGSDEFIEVACDQPSNYVANAEDCDDLDADAYPGADETCDGDDDDCDGDVDEDDAIDADTWYADSDGDGYGDAAHSAQACDQPSGFEANDDDCDDSDAAVNPDAVEVCDGIDNDCDGTVDGADASDAATWYADADGDGYGDADSTASACTQPTGAVADDTDCDDGDAAVNPGAAELCNGVDDDCDGDVDEDDASDAATWYQDRDEDGYGDVSSSTSACDAPDGYVADDSDCDDLDAEAHPGATEVCDGDDDDCDGVADEDDATDAATWYADSDGDGFGDAAHSTQACDQPSGFVDNSSDCDDRDATANPDAGEVCDGVDNDCDGTVDGADASDAATWYSDADGDGYGDAESTISACNQPTGAVADDTDCDDGDAAVNPGAQELCNGLDDDCDGDTDEDDAGDVSTWYQDRDEDGYGDSSSSVSACDAPEGYVADDGDCDDLDAQAYPGASEVCDGDDDDCDGVADEDDATDASTWYADSDGDGFGDVAQSSQACDQPSGFVADSSDCDDGDAAVSPDAEEVCDANDNDCDGDVDEDDASDAGTWYADSDGDGYGDGGVASSACTAPTGSVSDDSDCDDGDASVNPGATETCNGLDDDCDGDVDEDDASDASVWYEDRDEDGYGDASRTASACDAPEGYVADATDCDDLDPDAYPGATEVCDGDDEDCDGVADEDEAADASTWYADADGDGYGDIATSVTACDAPTGYGADSGDCDDTDGSVNPGASETCNGVDDDCDGTVDEEATDASAWYADADGDGYGDEGQSSEACEEPTGSVAQAGDCDDSDSAVNPGATETCDGVDEDCDGDVDEDASDAATWYGDADGDGYGATSFTQVACEQPSSYEASDQDCDDLDAAVNPGADELCNGIDDNCDGSVDEAGALDETTWYQDADGDGYGEPTTTAQACDQPSGYAAESTDCDDTDASINPDGSEACNGLDDDCDGVADDGVLGGSSTCAAVSCAEVIADNPSAVDDTYYLEGPATGIFEAWCEMDDDGGGWTLVGAVVNEGSRSWDSYDVWVDTSVFGVIGDRQAADFKSEAFYDVTGDDFLVRTEEYSFAFYSLLGDTDFASFMTDEYDSSACSTSFLASGADWSDVLSTSQAALQSFVVRPLDDNCDCFPGCNENAIIGMQLADCCWTPGLGNTPSGQADWDDHDLSLLQLANLNPSSCTAGSYPCNDQGYYNPYDDNCYDESCKLTWAEIFVR